MNDYKNKDKFDSINNNSDWEKAKQQYCGGWHTWNNDSILSYIYPLDGRGIRLCIKDYKNAAFMENILIGEDEAAVIPRAHAYDDSFTQLSVDWKDNRFEVKSSAVNDGTLYSGLLAYMSLIKD